MYKTLFLPILLYSCKAWIIRTLDSSRVQAVEMQCVITAGVAKWDHRYNEDVLNSLKSESILKHTLTLKYSTGKTTMSDWV